MTAEPVLKDLGIGGGDELQPIALVIPCYTNVPTRFLRNMLSLVAAFPAPLHIMVVQGVYPEQAMRHAMKEYLEVPGWERLVVIEQDMILPQDALVKHSLHTDDIVGSTYFQHSPPYQINVMFQDPKKQSGWGHPSPPVVKMMLEKPALYKCDIVGLGCTSIARRVLEKWPVEEIPAFRTDYEHNARDDEFTHGCVSHDVWFCIRARELGFQVYLDTSIRCDHLTEGFSNSTHYLVHAAEQERKFLRERGIVLPRNAKHNGGKGVPALAKSH